MTIEVKGFYQSSSGTVSYVVFDSISLQAMIIDSVLGFEITSGQIDYQLADKLFDYIKEQKLVVTWIVETHTHADHLTAAHYLKTKLQLQSQAIKVAASQHVVKVQQHFNQAFHLTQLHNKDAFDHLFTDQEVFYLGKQPVTVIETPGHTPDSITYQVANNLFVGDTLFMPDSGTARCDFPNGNAKQLYQSIKLLLALQSELKIWVCHDYQPNNSELSYYTTVGQQNLTNIHINQTVSEQAFVQLREQRDKTLAAPKLLVPAIQMNMNAGQLMISGNDELIYQQKVD